MLPWFDGPSALIGGLIGLLLGALLARVLLRPKTAGVEALARDLLSKTESHRQAETEALLDGVKLAFSDISLDAFKRASDELSKLAQHSLAAERRLQAHQLATERQEFEARIRSVTTHLEKMQNLIRELERDRVDKFSELATKLNAASDNVETLTQTTRKLADALANARVRGQWGERMADDVMQLLGLTENVNYLRQQTLLSGARPDFTFLLPNDFRLHMDVKFPFDNFLRSIENEDKADNQRFKTAFVRDVRSKISEVATRGYIAPEHGTLDFALLFIPNEQVYHGIFEANPALLDEALSRGVLMVSPISLLAVLAIVRRASAQIRIDQATGSLVIELENFRKAWQRYLQQEQKLGRRIDDAYAEFRNLTHERRQTIDGSIEAITTIVSGQPSAAKPLETAKMSGDNIENR